MSSKFLRVMALSKTPADFRRKSPAESIATKGTVPSEGTVPIEATVLHEGTASSKETVSSRGTIPRIYRCSTVQDGHSFAEDRLYNALWNYRNARNDGDECRLVTVGWDLMAQLSGMTPNNARQNCFRLIQKLALEKVQSHNSEQRIGTTYKIYSYTAIIRRRREARMEWVVRNRGGVTFVDSKGTVPSKGTVVTEDTALKGTVASEGMASIPTEGTPLSHISHIEVRRSQPSTSAVGSVISEVRKHLTVDDDASRILIQRCRQNDPNCTDEEIAHFAGISAAKIARQRNVENPTGLLISQVPKFFPGEELRAFRDWNAKELEKRRELARKIQEDSQASEQELEWAKRVLSR